MLVISQEVSLFEGTLLENIDPRFIGRKLKPKRGEYINESLLINNEIEIAEAMEQEITQKLLEFGFSPEKLD